jgi:hypothetical protein
LIYNNFGTCKIGQISSKFVLNDHAGGKCDHVEVYNHHGSVQISSGCDTGTLVNPGGTANPQNVPLPPVISGVTDANGTILSTWDGDHTGFKTGNQDA